MKKLGTASVAALRQYVRAADAKGVNTDVSTPDIALRLGYSETSSFHRKFKAIAGITPGEFKQAKASN